MKAALLRLLNHSSLLLFAAVLVLFGCLAPAFRTPENGLNILVQTASTGILAVGMTFVLLTAGVDLSVGSIMFVTAAIGGKLALAGWPLGAVTAVMLATALLYGILNGLLITRLAIMAFVVTLATRFFGRGLGLRLTETRAMNLPASFYDLGAAHFLHVPVPVWIFGTVVLLAHLTLTRTPFGRQIYAVGADLDAARKAGIATGSVLGAVYLICAGCAAVASLVALSQAPAVSPTFGKDREFMAIAAAVLGGTSLFGGRGAVFPGTVLGAALLQTVENGLNILNVNPYLYPLILSGTILFAVLTDSARNAMLTRLQRRKIYLSAPGD